MWLRRCTACPVNQSSFSLIGPTRQHYKPYEELSERQRRRMKRSWESTCEASLSLLEQEGYEPLSVEVRNRETGNIKKSAWKYMTWKNCLGMNLPLIKNGYFVTATMYMEAAYCFSPAPIPNWITPWLTIYNCLWEFVMYRFNCW